MDTTQTENQTTSAHVAGIIQQQIGTGVFMRLGAHKLGHCMWAMAPETPPLPSLAFKARILPFTQSGTRSSAPRTMRVIVSLNGADLYDVRVEYAARGDRYGLKPAVVHYECDDLPADCLPRVMLALDFDGDTTLNPAAL